MLCDTLRWPITDGQRVDGEPFAWTTAQSQGARSVPERSFAGELRAWFITSRGP